MDKPIVIVESLPLKKYVITKKTRSRIDPLTMVQTIKGARCPNCGEENDLPSNSNVMTCACGLKMQIGGEYLFCKVEARHLQTKDLEADE